MEAAAGLCLTGVGVLGCLQPSLSGPQHLHLMVCQGDHFCGPIIGAPCVHM